MTLNITKTIYGTRYVYVGKKPKPTYTYFGNNTVYAGKIALINQFNVNEIADCNYHNFLDLEKWLKYGTNPYISFYKLNMDTVPDYFVYLHYKNNYHKTFNQFKEWISEHWLMNICKHNWKCFKYISNPTYKIKQLYYKLLSNRKYVKKQKITKCSYNYYKPLWDERNYFNIGSQPKKNKKN